MIPTPTQHEDARPGHKSLDYVVQNVQLDIGETGSIHYQRYLQWAFRGVKEIGKWTNQNLKSVMIPVNKDNMTVPWPNDYMGYTKIGVPVTFNNRVEILILGFNENLALPAQVNSCGEPITEAVSKIANNNYSPYFNTTFAFSNYFHNGQFVSGVYGLGGGFTIGYYNIDKENSQFVLSSDFPYDFVILEYNSTGVNINKGTYVREEAVETLIAYIKWRREEYRPGSNRLDVGDKRRMYTSELKNLRKLEEGMTGQEFVDIINRGKKLTASH